MSFSRENLKPDQEVHISAYVYNNDLCNQALLVDCSCSISFYTTTTTTNTTTTTTATTTINITKINNVVFAISSFMRHTKLFHLFFVSLINEHHSLFISYVL